MNYEGQICRAPMERSSFMLPVMVGCSYNRCKFCNLFRHLRYRELPMEQIEAELDRVKSLGGQPKKIFLGDGNAFGLKTAHLLEILKMIEAYFPECEAVNMDATITSIRMKSEEELKMLCEHGVRHLYIGIETGLNDVLLFMKKDHDLGEAYEQIARLQAAGMFYDAHIMTGIAGTGRGQENAEALAKFLNETHPKHVVNFSMFLHKEVELYKDVEAGTFLPCHELENLKEERILLENIEPEEGEAILYDGFHDYIEARVRGTLPKDREKMLAKLDRLIEKYENEPPIYSYVTGECPNLEKEADASPIWEMEDEKRV